MNDLTITIEHIKNSEQVNILLKAGGNRFETLNNELDKFDMYFGDEMYLYECGNDQVVAKLVTDSNELQNWLTDENGEPRK